MWIRHKYYSGDQIKKDEMVGHVVRVGYVRDA